MQYASFFMSSFHTTTLFRINGEAVHKQKSLKSEELSNDSYLFIATWIFASITPLFAYVFVG